MNSTFHDGNSNMSQVRHKLDGTADPLYKSSSSSSSKDKSVYKHKKGINTLSINAQNSVAATTDIYENFVATSAPPLPLQYRAANWPRRDARSVYNKPKNNTKK